jgi:hypothetical protein
MVSPPKSTSRLSGKCRKNVLFHHRRAFTARRNAVITANPELPEREALKELGLVASMTDALKQRGVAELTAHVAAQLGALALRITYERWLDTTSGEAFDELAQRTLTRLRAANPLC